MINNSTFNQYEPLMIHRPLATRFPHMELIPHSSWGEGGGGVVVSKIHDELKQNNLSHFQIQRKLFANRGMDGALIQDSNHVEGQYVI